MERSDARKARRQREGHESHWDPTVAELIDEARAQAWDEGFAASEGNLMAAESCPEIPPLANPYRKADR